MRAVEFCGNAKREYRVDGSIGREGGAEFGEVAPTARLEVDGVCVAFVAKQQPQDLQVRKP